MLLPVLVVILPTSARADVFYRETFNFCEAPSARPSAEGVAGWTALTTGHVHGKPSVLKIQPVGAAAGFAAVNSEPEGPEDGNAYWGRAARGLLIFTEELSFEISELSAVAWRQRIDREDKAFANYGARLALLIGDLWYISDYSATQRMRGKFERVELAPLGLTYGTTPNTPGIGPAAPTNSGISLPSIGPVTAFGLFLGRAYDKVRVDDFVLINNAPAGTYASDITFERCTPAVSAPLPNVALAGADADAGGHCAADDAPTRVSIASRSRNKLLRTSRGRSVLQYRDRVLLTLASMGLPLNWVAAIAPQDLSKVRKTYYLRLASGERLRISSSLGDDLTRYIRLAGLAPEPNSPLFRHLIGGRTVSSIPLCVSDLVNIVTFYAQKAKVTNKLAYL